MWERVEREVVASVPRGEYWSSFVRLVSGMDERSVEAIPDEVVRRAAIIVRENRDISISDAARLVGVSPTTLSRKVKEFLAGRGEAGGGGGGGSGGSGGSSGGRGGRGSPLPFRADMSDVELIENVVRARLEQKYPIAYKIVKDMSWFANVVLDMGIIATVFALRHSEGKIDFSSPEKSVKQLTDVLERLADRAARAEELEERLRQAEEELESLRVQLRQAEEEKARLLERVERLEDAIERTREKLRELVDAIEKILPYVERVVGAGASLAEAEAS